jgi:hypothetical protein
LVLINQLMATFKADLAPFLAAVLPPMTRQVAEALAPFAGVNGCVLGLKVDGVGVGAGVEAGAAAAAAENTEEAREAREAGLYMLNAVDPELESAWFQPSHL